MKISFILFLIHDILYIFMKVRHLHRKLKKNYSGMQHYQRSLPFHAVVIQASVGEVIIPFLRTYICIHFILPIL